jgi:dipeptidyl aminopeptidase/acylaminoacyl peptidase
MRLAWIALAAAVACGSAEAAPALEDYGQLPAVEQMTLSPSGDQIAMVAVIGEERRVVAMSADGKARLAMTVGGLKVRDLDWVGEDHLLVANSQVVSLPFVFAAKYELGSRIEIDLKAKRPSVIFSKNRMIYPAVLRDYGVQEVDGRWYGFFGAVTLERGSDGENYLNHTFVDLYRVDMESGDTHRLAEGNDLEHEWAIAADGSVTARSEYEQKTGDWRLVAGAFGGRQLMARKAPLDEIDILGLGRTPDSVLVIDGTGDERVIEEQPISGAAPTPLFQDVDVKAYLHAAKDRLLIGALVEGPEGAVLFDPTAQARFNGARKALKGYEVSLVSFTDDFNRMIVFTDGGDDSGTYWLVDIATRNAKPLGQAYPSITAKDVGPTSMVHYKAADGTALDGVLTLPPGREARDLPVVIMPHGGPIGPHDEIGFDWWAQAFASRGYAVFQPNYRGSGGRGRAFKVAGYGEWGRKMQTDVSDGLAAIARQGVVDPKRACIVGGSYGGYAALAGVTLQQGLYRCAVSYGGVSDLQGMLADTAERSGGGDNETMRFWREAIGLKSGGGDLLSRLSPASLADKADAPILLIHGKEDTVVNPSQTTRMAAALKRAGKPFEVKMLDGEDHWMSHKETRISTLQASVAFVEKYNPAS